MLIPYVNLDKQFYKEKKELNYMVKVIQDFYS